MNNAFDGWTREQDAALIAKYHPGCDLATIARQLGRSIGAVAHRAVKLGLMVRRGRSIENWVRL